jgi:hypothetical protein
LCDNFVDGERARCHANQSTNSIGDRYTILPCLPRGTKLQLAIPVKEFKTRIKKTILLFIVLGVQLWTFTDGELILLVVLEIEAQPTMISC